MSEIPQMKTWEQAQKLWKKLGVKSTQGARQAKTLFVNWLVTNGLDVEITEYYSRTDENLMFYHARIKTLKHSDKEYLDESLRNNPHFQRLLRGKYIFFIEGEDRNSESLIRAINRVLQRDWNILSSIQQAQIRAICGEEKP